MNAKKKSKRRTKRKIGCCWRSRPDPPISSHLLRSLLRLPVSLERNQFFSPVPFIIIIIIIIIILFHSIFIWI